MCRPVHQPAISSTKEGQVIQASDQPQATEHLHPKGTLQDGGGQHDQRPFTSRGLDVLFGPQGTINQPKSQTIPVQRIRFLGFLVDSNLMKLLLPQEKIDNIIQMRQSLQKQPQATVCQLSQLLGKMTAAASAVLSAPIRYRHLQQLKIQS